MKILRDRLQLETTDALELVDITANIKTWLQRSGARDGMLTLMSRHTTARLTLNERDPALQRDMIAFLQRVAPPDAAYAHNEHTVDDRANAHAHLLGLFINASESIPVADGALVLGEWQSIFFVELDGPRPRREVELQFMGEMA